MKVKAGETTRILVISELKEFFKALDKDGVFTETDSTQIPVKDEAVILEIGTKFKKESKLILKIWRWWAVKYQGKAIYAWKVVKSNIPEQYVGRVSTDKDEDWRGFFNVKEMHSTLVDALEHDAEGEHKNSLVK